MTASTLHRLAVLAMLLGLTAAATDYCKLCSDHVLCKHPTSKPGAACKSYVRPTISNSDKDLIVRLHNEYRNKVALGQEKRGKNHPQPSASNMRKIVWDNELATFAQRWADQCTFEHDTCHTTADGTVSGQNLLSGGLAPNQKKPDWANAIKIWYDEVAARDGSLNTKPFKVDNTFMDVGHFTQLAWANTYAVGCGYSTYRAGSGSAPDTQLVVCDYKPSGNFEGDVVYEGGAPASKCPAGTSKDKTYPGLCAAASSGVASQSTRAASTASVKISTKAGKPSKKSNKTPKKPKHAKKSASRHNKKSKRRGQKENKQ